MLQSIAQAYIFGFGVGVASASIGIACLALYFDYCARRKRKQSDILRRLLNTGAFTRID